MACLLILLPGCAGRYFRDAGDPARPVPQYRLGNLPFKEYWTGIVFNGDKIGFTHFMVNPSRDERDLFEIRSQAFMHFRFLMMDKKVSLVSYDLVDRDMHLLRFSYEYDIDGSTLRLDGAFVGDRIKVVRSSGRTSVEEDIPAERDLYPGSALYLYPLMHGLKLGQAYEYRIYDSEAQCISTVSQKITAYQRSDLFAGEAYRMETIYQGQKLTTWLDEQGLPVLEMALNGILISGLETEGQAKHYLLESSLNKNESLLEFSLIRVREPIGNPASVRYLEVFLDGIPKEMVIPSDERQECERNGDRVLCRISGSAASKGPVDQGAQDGLEKYLKPNFIIPSNNDEIRSLARKITEKASTQTDQIRALLLWMRDNIKKEPVDVFTALDVLSGRKAECQGHAYLYAAFARSLNIPTRVANGIVYADNFKGFLYHAWDESFVQGRWVAVDPTLQQLPADATHIKFMEGEALSSLIPLVSIMGKVHIEVVKAE